MCGEAFPLSNSVGFPTPSITDATKECIGSIEATTFGAACALDTPIVMTKRNAVRTNNLQGCLSIFFCSYNLSEFLTVIM